MSDFWSNVVIGIPDECWPWTAYSDRDGYGVVGTRKYGTRVAHRVAWELEIGSIPDSMQVLHDCDNPPCCNPLHLFLGSSADNLADKMAKGRQARGERTNTAKLTAEEVMAMREEYATGVVTQQELADLHGLRQGSIGAVLNGKTWRHL